MIADRYEVIRPIGRGSFAQTLLAVDTTTDRQVALKALHPRRAADWKSFDLFDREAAVLRTLSHPGIPTVYEVFRSEWEGSDAAFISMEYVEGESFADMIAAQRAIAPEALVRLLVDMLGVLEYLHTRAPPILHRDIKPGNVIVRPSGAPVLVDFGAVRNVFLGAEEDGSTIVGTYGYMPFEQLMGRAMPASDLYALGATFLHLATGRPPSQFLTEDGGELRVPRVLPGGPVFRSAIARMLRAAPSERFPSAAAARNAILSGDAEDETVSEATHAIRLAIATGEAVPGKWLELPPPGRREARLIAALATQLTPSVRGRMRAFANDRGETRRSDIVQLGLLTLATAGVIPLVIWAQCQARRDELEDYLRKGDLVTAVIERIDRAAARVHYAFEVDREIRRGTDSLPEGASNLWTQGMLVQVLHIEGDEAHSILVSV